MPPSLQHEARHRLFQYEGDFFARAITSILGVPVPEPASVSLLSVDLTEIRPIERRPDTVLLVTSAPGNSPGKFIIVVESQTDPEETRRRRWPYYIAFLHDKYECPVLLLVICSKKETAEWAREPIAIGLGCGSTGVM